MVKQGFSKGDAVTLFIQYDNKGTVQVTDMTVHSCGKKQMILVDDSGEKFHGRLIPPSGDGKQYLQVKPRMTEAEAEAFALELGRVFVESEREQVLRLRSLTTEDRINYALSLLHEPRVRRGA